MDYLFQSSRWADHWLKCQSSHSIHSPALFYFYNNVIEADLITKWSQDIEHIRQNLIQDRSEIKWIELGSGNKASRSNLALTVGDIARTNLTPAPWCRLLNRVVDYFKPNHILELGTSLGISTLYLSNNSLIDVWSIDGNPEVIRKASEIFKRLERKNLHVFEGSIDRILAPILNKIPQLRFSFIDANHQYQATLDYVHQVWNKTENGGVVIIDDIHRSPGMEKAWNELKNLTECQATFDLFRWGLLVKGPSELTGRHVWSYSSLFKSK